MSVAALVLGILGLVTSCCTFGTFSILAVVFGHLGMNETRDGSKSGRGMAVAGLVMGYIVAAPAILFSVWVIFMGGLGIIGAGTTTTTP
jgi:hypothetical protein